jgi:hypothetical protein
MSGKVSQCGACKQSSSEADKDTHVSTHEGRAEEEARSAPEGSDALALGGDDEGA